MKVRQDVSLNLSARQTLGQDMIRVIGFLGLSNAELGDRLGDLTAGNRFIDVVLPAPPGASGASTRFEADAADQPDLFQHVLAQLPLLLSDPADRPIALALLDTLDASGFVAQPLERIAQDCGCALARVEKVLSDLQAIEPTGLFARSLPDSLALQLAEQGRLTPGFSRLLDNLDLVAKGQLQELCRICRLSPEELRQHLARLKGLVPRPAAGFSRQPVTVRTADLIAERAGAGWTARLNPATQPRIRLAAAPDRAGAPGGEEYRKALSLSRAFEMRNRSLLALGQYVTAVQSAFLEHGETHLRGLTLRAAAAELDLHESTVGRIANATAIETGAGPVALRRFFGAPHAGGDGADDLAVQAVTARIAAYIGQEPADRPHSDADIARWLRDQNLQVSRRTVANYRTRAGIPARPHRRRSTAQAPG